MAVASQADEALPSLAMIERVLDAQPLRVAARLANALGEIKKRGRGKSSGPPGPEQVEEPSAEQLVRLLSQALSLGALDTARHTSVALRSRLSELEDSQRDAAAHLLLECMMASGDHAQASRWALANLAALHKTRRGIGALEVLGLASSTASFAELPNLLGLSRRIARGELDAETLAGIVGSSPRTWLRYYDLNLLFFSALWPSQPEQATRFLSRFLEAYGMGAVRTNATMASSNVLAALSFPPIARVTTGPLVSIVVAARNATNTIRYAIDSLLAQSYRACEILICDDASDDDTMDILRQRYAAEPRVRLFYSTQQQGSYNVRNALSAEARGELITFHDADDLALPRRIALQVERMRRKGLQACVTSGLRVTSDGQIAFFKDQQPVRLSMVSLMVTKSLLRRLGRFRSARFGADQEFYERLKLADGVSVGRVAVPTILSHWGPNSLTRSAGAESLEDGYRSPARREYSEMVYRLRRGVAGPNDADMDRQLLRTDNYFEPRPIVTVA